jgi:hypothetical protein
VQVPDTPAVKSPAVSSMPASLSGSSSSRDNAASDSFFVFQLCVVGLANGRVPYVFASMVNILILLILFLKTRRKKITINIMGNISLKLFLFFTEQWAVDGL